MGRSEHFGTHFTVTVSLLFSGLGEPDETRLNLPPIWTSESET